LGRAALGFAKTPEAAASKSAHESTRQAYYFNSEKKRTQLNDLFASLKNADDEEDRYFLIREIANIYGREKSYNKMIIFLQDEIKKNSDSSYNSYFLLMIAYAYASQNASAVATLYYDTIVRNYPDLLVDGKSIHLQCLKQLIELTHRPERKILYYDELLSKFKDSIDLGVTYFMLGRTYEAAGEWSKAINAYDLYSKTYGDSIIPGYPSAYTYAKRMVNLNNSAKNWTFDSLQALLEVIERSLDEGNIRRLWNYRAKANFFARNWAQQEGDDEGFAEFSLTSFAPSAKIRYSQNFEPGSNANEAYLRTTGWSTLFTPVWYLYFRKIYFPLDLNIHGKWEWAGIYYGERF
jgi:tetratricopeptide (TPR) repeat protein